MGLFSGGNDVSVDSGVDSAACSDNAPDTADMIDTASILDALDAALDAVISLDSDTFPDDISDNISTLTDTDADVADAGSMMDDPPAVPDFTGALGDVPAPVREVPDVADSEPLMDEPGATTEESLELLIEISDPANTVTLPAVPVEEVSEVDDPADVPPVVPEDVVIDAAVPPEAFPEFLIDEQVVEVTDSDASDLISATLVVEPDVTTDASGFDLFSAEPDSGPNAETVDIVGEPLVDDGVILDESKEQLVDDGVILDESEEPLVDDGVTLDESEEPLVDDGVILDESEAPLVDDGVILDESEAPLVDDGVILDESEAPLVDDGVILDESEEPLVDDGVTLDESEAPLVDDGVTLDESEASLVDEETEEMTEDDERLADVTDSGNDDWFDEADEFDPYEVARLAQISAEQEGAIQVVFNSFRDDLDFDRSYVDQLELQEMGLRAMTHREFLANVEGYAQHGRQGDHERQYREAAAIIHVDDGGEADTIDEARASFKGLDAIHLTDQIAGGSPDLVCGLCDSRVNRSIGSKWKSLLPDVVGEVQRRLDADGSLADAKLNIRLIPTRKDE